MSKRLTGHKLHLGVDEQSGFILCHTTNLDQVHVLAELRPLLKQRKEQSTLVTAVSVNGAFDTKQCIDELLERHIIPTILSRRDTVPYPRRTNNSTGRNLPATKRLLTLPK